MAEADTTVALKLELKKRYAEAAEIWLACGQVEKAIFNYHRAGNVKRAIDVALAKGLNRKAAEMYLKAELYDKAAELFRAEGDLLAAARALRSGGRLADAAKLFETAGEYSEAARLHESVNDFMRAGELYEKGSDLESSARVYELAIDTKALERLGGKRDLARVAQVLTKVKNFEKAAEIFVQSQEVAEACLLFVRMGEVDGAARLLANCQADVGYEILAQIDYTDRSAVDFARMFYAARDYQKAARVFEGCGEHAKAGYLFEKCQDYERAAMAYAAAADDAKAAQMFEKAGSWADAGDLYLRAQEPLRAAICFEAAEDFYQSGKLYLDVERFDKAMDLLQKVEPSSARYTDACLLVADLMRRKGFLDLAIDRYRAAIRGLSCDSRTFDHFYQLACILQEKREFAEAEKLLVAVANVSFGHRDSAQRLEDVRRRLAETPAMLKVPAASAATVPGLASGAAAPDESEKGFMVGRMEGFEVLSSTPLFADLTLAEMKRFWEICETRAVRKESVVVEEGVTGAGLWVIRSGSIDVTKVGDMLVRLHAGEFFGEMSLVDASSQTSASCIAAEDCDLFFLARDKFGALLAASDNTALKMYRVFVTNLCARLRAANQELAALRREGE